MKEGFYRIEVPNLYGPWTALVAMEAGQIVGCNTDGGLFDGTYQWNEQTQQLDTESTITTKKTLFPVEGAMVRAGKSMNVRVSFPRETAAITVPANTEFGPVSVRISFVRAIPD